MPFTIGDPVPWFRAPTASEPEFAFEGAAGRYVLLAFLPLDAAARAGALRALAAHQTLFELGKLVAFVVARDPETIASSRDLRALRWMHDPDLRVSRLFDPGGDGSSAPAWMLLDPSLRIMAIEPLEETAAFFLRLGELPSPSDHAGTTLHAPVLTVPRVFEPELCRRLIDLHEADGGRFTGVMRDEGERTIAVMDELKKRRDIYVEDPALIATLRSRLDRHLFPMIERCLGFAVTQVERYLVSCYDSADDGVFHAHRDSSTHGTAHRRFACSINLNDDFEGGDLRFAEFGGATYRPPAGGAVVFSCALMHEARPVKRGRRYAFLPFLHDEAGAAVLAAYEARIRQASEAGS